MAEDEKKAASALRGRSTIPPGLWPSIRYYANARCHHATAAVLYLSLFIVWCSLGAWRRLRGRLLPRLVRVLDCQHVERNEEKDVLPSLRFVRRVSEFSSVDRSDFHEMDRPEKRRKYICSLDMVQQRLREFNFIVYHEGWIPEPFQTLVDSHFCFVHIDVDLYQPTRDSFEFLYPRLSPNGVMVFDDYGSVKFPSTRQAIDECLGRVRDAFFVALPAGQAFLIKLLQPAERVL